MLNWPDFCSPFSVARVVQFFRKNRSWYIGEKYKNSYKKIDVMKSILKLRKMQAYMVRFHVHYNCIRLIQYWLDENAIPEPPALLKFMADVIPKLEDKIVIKESLWKNRSWHIGEKYKNSYKKIDVMRSILKLRKMQAYMVRFHVHYNCIRLIQYWLDENAIPEPPALLKFMADVIPKLEDKIGHNLNTFDKQ
uniref:Uncharacterized protein n=1 Tax=Rhabditophanes sp. KR3021 TaxID=114890 RepID=A0AC35TH65_9BILA